MPTEPISNSDPGSSPTLRLNITAVGAESPPEPELKGLRFVRVRRSKTPASDRRPAGEIGGEPPKEIRIVVELKPPASVSELRRGQAEPGSEKEDAGRMPAVPGQSSNEADASKMSSAFVRELRRDEAPPGLGESDTAASRRGGTQPETDRSASISELRRDEALPGREALEQPPSNPVPSIGPIRPISLVSPLGPRREHEQVAPIPARMLNEFVYCQRLFYYEFVEGVFVESADTVRGQTIHQRVDSGNGSMPKASKKPTAGKGRGGAEKSGTGAEAQTKEGGSAAAAATEAPPTAEPEVIHSR